MLAEISVAPADHWDHMSPYVAESLQLIKNSGLDYQLGPMGTVIEGEPEAVFDLVKSLHLNMRKHSLRISTTIKIDDDVRRPTGRMIGKVVAVEEKIAGGH